VRSSFIVSAIFTLALGGLVIGCSDDRTRYITATKTATAPGIFAGVSGVSIVTSRLDTQRARILGEGWLGVGPPSNSDGFSCFVQFWAVFSGRNVPQQGETPHLFPNYKDGADNGRPADHYSPIPMRHVKTDASGAQLWTCTVTTFPVGGSFLANFYRNFDANGLLRGVGL
jgi:hypothetical protein